MALYRKPHIFQIVPDTGMLDYCVALIVANLYSCIQDPEREEVPQEIADANHGGIQHFIWTLKQQNLILANWVSEDSVNIYSKTRKRPIEKNQSLDLLAQSDTEDLLIYGHDLLLGDRYAANYLPDVICNAKRILSIYSSELTQIFPSVKLGTSAAEKPTGISNKSWVEIQDLVDMPQGNSETPEARRTRLKARVAEIKAKGTKAFLKFVAEEESISRTRLKQLLKDEPLVNDNLSNSSWSGLLVTTRQASSKKPSNKY